MIPSCRVGHVSPEYHEGCDDTHATDTIPFRESVDARPNLVDLPSDVMIENGGPSLNEKSELLDLVFLTSA